MEDDFYSEDKKAVKKNRKKEKLKLLNELNDIQQILALSAGRRFFGEMFKFGCVEEQIFSGNSTAYHKLGIHRRTIKYWILAQHADIEAFIDILLFPNTEKDNSRLLEDIKAILQIPSGITFFKNLFQSKHIEKSNIFTGNSNTYFNLGLRRFTRKYWNLVKEADPEAFARILRSIHSDSKPLISEEEFNDD